MINQKDTTILIVPGLRDHVEQHWQTLLVSRLTKFKTVPPLENDKLNLAARVQAIQSTIETIDGPIIVVAHSGGTVMMAHWAQKHSANIKAVLLAVPPDFERPLPAAYPTMEQFSDNGWLPVPRTRLPFRSLVAASSNDPLADLDRVVALAQDWGSELINLGNVGHLNPASGYGEWHDADGLIQQLIDQE